MKKTYEDSDFEEKEKGYRLPPSRYPPQGQFRGASIDPRRVPIGYRGHLPPQGMRPPSQRFGGPMMMHPRERPPYITHKYKGYDYDAPERPGFYLGNRPFRMDKMRNEPLEIEEDNYVKGH